MRKFWVYFFGQSHLQKEINRLERRIEILEGWIQYYEENKGTIDDV